MGTRADFYVGRGKDAEWLGSIAWDGYRDGIDKQILNCQSEAAFRHAVGAFLAKREDKTLPHEGWPWPWDTSATSDCSYWFFEGRCWDALGSPEFYAPCDEPAIDEDDDSYAAWSATKALVEFPDMSARKNVKWGKGSGLLIIGLPEAVTGSSNDVG